LPPDYKVSGFALSPVPAIAVWHFPSLLKVMGHTSMA
jgi:hypothetical protein